MFDYNKNKIGFANKIRNFNSEIVGEGAPGPQRLWYQFGKEDEPIMIIDDQTPTQPVGPKIEKDDTKTWDNTSFKGNQPAQNQRSNQN